MKIKISAEEFVKWLLSRPRSKLMRPMKPMQALLVVRRLAELGMSDPERDFLWDLVQDALSLIVRLADGRTATNDECLNFFEHFGPYFATQKVDRALQVLKITKEFRIPRALRSPSQVEYRMERNTLFAPAASWRPRLRRRQQQDDISERLALAVDAMTEANCPTPPTHVLKLMKESRIVSEHYCTVQHLTSRIKALGDRRNLMEQEHHLWLQCYQHFLRPQDATKGPSDPKRPDRFVFLKCDCSRRSEA